MAERYTRLFSLEKPLYAEGSPVIIEAGALLMDSVGGNVLAQLKFKSISPKIIKALTVSVTAKDTVGRTIGAPTVHQYLDMNIGRDAEFGQKAAVALPSANTRAFEVRVLEAAFADNSVWAAPNGLSWEPLPVQVPLLSDDAELLKQYRMDINQAAAVELRREKDLWFCTCGAANRAGESTCHCCGKSLSAMENADISKLRERCAARLEEERRAAEAKRIAAEKAAKKTKKLLSIAIPAVIAVIAIVLVVTKIVIPNSNYNAAVDLMNSGKYEEAITAFKAMDGYKDSADKISECKYKAAVELLESGKYEEAIAAFEAMNGYKDSADKISECKYRAAVALIESGKYTEAIAALDALNGYKDSAEKAKSVYEQHYMEMLKVAEVGDTVYFGTYEQDNDTSNGKEKIEWQVLANENNRVLVISKYGLDCQQYNIARTDVTWESCTLRAWLNETFLNSAFSSSEQAAIAQTTVTADKNPEYDTDPGNATTDKVFLLSIDEANKYFSSSSARQCKPTAYAVANGASESGSGNCWWLRSSGYHQDYAAIVLNFSFGSVDDSGSYVNFDTYAVRPAMWIDLGS